MTYKGVVFDQVNDFQRCRLQVIMTHKGGLVHRLMTNNGGVVYRLMAYE